MTSSGKAVVIISFIIIAATLYGLFRFFRFSFEMKGKAEIVLSLADSAEISKVKAGIDEIPEIDRAVFVSKEEAMKAFREEMGDDAGVFEVLSSNPLPNSFIVTLKGRHAAPETFERVASRLGYVQGVEDVRYEKGFLERFFHLIKLGERIVLIGGIVILAYAGLVILAIFRSGYGDKGKVWKTF